jgi:hypothetical protein
VITPSFGLTATERVLPKLALDFTTASLDSRVTFTRTTSATYVDSSGLIAAATIDQARFDFDPVTLACKGLLIEESRTNLMLYSQDLTQVAWTNLTNASMSSPIYSSPDGGTNACLMTENTATGQRSIRQSVITSPTAQNTVSCFFKANGRTTVRITMDAGGTVNGSARADFDLVAKTASSVTAANGATAGAAFIQEYPDGWFRCGFNAIPSTLGISVRTIILMNNGASYVGNDTSGVYFYGAQLEAGAFATSYIPTEASQVTRTVDLAAMTGTNFSDWYNAGAGGVVARVLPSTVSGTRPALQFDDATADEVIALRSNTTNPELVIVNGGSPQAQIDAGTIAANTAYNLGAAWGTDNCAAAVNGGAAVTDTSATIPTVTQARLGSDGTNYLNGQIQTVRYWPQRLINSEVQAFSKG